MAGAIHNGATCGAGSIAYTPNTTSVNTNNIAVGGLLNLATGAQMLFATPNTAFGLGNVTVPVYMNGPTHVNVVDQYFPALLVQVSYQLYPPATDVCDASNTIIHNCTLFSTSTTSCTTSTCTAICPTSCTNGNVCGIGNYYCPLPTTPANSVYVVRFYIGSPPSGAASQVGLGEPFATGTTVPKAQFGAFNSFGTFPNGCVSSASESHSKSHMSYSKSHMSHSGSHSKSHKSHSHSWSKSHDSHSHSHSKSHDSHSHSHSRSPSISPPVYDRAPVNLVVNGGCDSTAYAKCGAVAPCGTNGWELPQTSLSCGTYCFGGSAPRTDTLTGWVNGGSAEGFGCVNNNITLNPTYGSGVVVGYPYQGTGFLSANYGSSLVGAMRLTQTVSVGIPAVVVNVGLVYVHVIAAMGVANSTQLVGTILFQPPNTFKTAMSATGAVGNIPTTITWVLYSYTANLPAATTSVQIKFDATIASGSVFVNFAQIDSVVMYIYTSACLGLPTLPVNQNYTGNCNATYTPKGAICTLACVPGYVSSGGNFSAVCNQTWSNASFISNNWVLGTGACVHSQSESHSDSHSKSHRSYSHSKSHDSHSHSKSHKSHSHSKSHDSHSHSKSHASDSKSHRSHSHSKSHASDSRSHSKSHQSDSASHHSHSHHSESPVYPHIAQAPTNASFCTAYTAPYGASHGASVVATCPLFFEVCHINFAFFGVMNGTCNTTLMMTNPTCMWNLTASALPCIGSQSCSIPWPGTVDGVPAGGNTCVLANNTITTMIIAGGCCSTLPQSSSASDSHSKSHYSDSKSHASESHSKSHDSHSHSKSHGSHSHSKSHGSHSHSKSHDSHSISRSHDSDSRSKSHGSHSHSKSHDSHSYSKSHDSHSRSKSRDSQSHSKSHDSYSLSKSRKSDSHSKSHDSQSQSKSHASDSHSKSHASYSHSKSHASDSHSKSHASDSHSKSHGSYSSSKSHESHSKSDSPSHSTSHQTDSHSKSHHSHSDSRSHASNSHSTSHDSNSRSASHQSRSHSASHASHTRSASHNSLSHSNSHASKSSSVSHLSRSSSQSEIDSSPSNSASRWSHSTSRSHSTSHSASGSVSANPIFTEHFVTMGIDMDACFSVTALKTGGINATLACPPFSVFRITDFAAVGIAETPNRCAPDVDLTINDCWFNITTFMAARCNGQPSCTFQSSTDLAASNFSLHACASYRFAPTITFDFYAQCVSTVTVEVANPVFVGGSLTAVAVATAPTATCPAQLRVAPAAPYISSHISLVVALPGQWGLQTVMVHVVSYLSSTRTMLTSLPGVAVLLQFSAAGLPFVLANYPGSIETSPVDPALRFVGQCPVLAAAEAPQVPTDDVYIVFSDIVDAPPDAIEFIFINVLPDEFFYVSSIVIVDSNGTTVTFFPPTGTNLVPYVLPCAACAARYVASDVLID